MAKLSKAILFLLATFAATAGAQAPPGPEGGAERETPEQILRRIRENLKKAEGTLLQAGTPGEAGGLQKQVIEDIKKLLDEAKGSQENVSKDLQKIIEMAREQERQSQSGGGGGRQRKPPPRNEPDQRDRQKQSGQDQPKDGPDRKKDQPQKQRGDTKPPDSPKGKTDHPNVNEQWGDLPPALIEKLSNKEETLYPTQYKSFIKEYYKRLSEPDSR